MQNNPVIVEVARSPMGRGKRGGALSEVHPADLLRQVFVGLMARANIDPGRVDDLIVGCVSQAGEQAVPVGRTAWLAAGYPVSVPCTMVERRCGSAQQAVHFAAQGVAAGVYDVVIAAGVESMSRVPMGTARLGMDLYGEEFPKMYPGMVGQGVSAELISARWKISREESDAYASRSHQLAEQARRAGGLAAEIVPIQTPRGIVGEDETIRADTTFEGLAKLKVSFADEEISARFPEINWSITAGNSSQVTDGASAALIMSEAAATQLGLRARARFLSFDVIGDDPLLMLTAPIPATKRVLAKAGLALDQVDHFEVNEAFAPIPLAWLREFDVDPSRLNPRGGAIALGHPLGASGIRLLASLLHGLEETGGRYGLQTMCEGGGLANATIIERL